jgi:hypothetical protein
VLRWPAVSRLLESIRSCGSDHVTSVIVNANHGVPFGGKHDDRSFFRLAPTRHTARSLTADKEQDLIQRRMASCQRPKGKKRLRGKKAGTRPKRKNATRPLFPPKLKTTRIASAFGRIGRARSVTAMISCLIRPGLWPHLSGAVVRKDESGYKCLIINETEGVRFELTRPFGLPVFKTGAINRSATPPKKLVISDR